jgi:hypothetical protein
MASSMAFSNGIVPVEVILLDDAAVKFDVPEFKEPLTVDPVLFLVEPVLEPVLLLVFCAFTVPRKKREPVSSKIVWYELRILKICCFELICCYLKM